MSSEFRKKVNYLIHDINQGTSIIGIGVNHIKKQENPTKEDFDKALRYIEGGVKTIKDIEDYFYKYAQTHPDWDKKEEK